MKFQDTSLHGSKVTVGIKSVTYARMHARTHTHTHTHTHTQAKSDMPHLRFQSGGHNNETPSSNSVQDTGRRQKAVPYL